MSYKKINLQQQLRRVAQRKRTDIPMDILAALTLRAFEAGPATADVAPHDKRRGGWLPFMTGLYALEDPRV